MKSLILSLAEKPLFGMSTSITSFLLAVFHLVDPVLAFGGALFGCLAAIYSFRIKRAQFRALDKK
jgi:hypothetical protein